MNENNPLNLAEHCLVTLTFKLQCCKGLAVTHSLCKQSLFIKKKPLHKECIIIYMERNRNSLFFFFCLFPSYAYAEHELSRGEWSIKEEKKNYVELCVQML